MLHMMLERGEAIHSVVFFDTGWEFPAMLSHIDKVEQRIDMPIIHLKPPCSFGYWLHEREVRPRSGPNKGKLRRTGSGWPSPMRRWCTREKTNVLLKYARAIEDSLTCIGYALGEEKRLETQMAKRSPRRYPLIEWGISEAEALSYCYGLGYTWGGLYNHFDRVSCFCCPLQSLRNLRVLRRHFPLLWTRMLNMDSRIENNRGFNHDATVYDLDIRFAREDAQSLKPSRKITRYAEVE